MMPPANAGSAPGSQLGGMDPVEDPDRLFDFFIAPSAYRSPSETSGPSMQTPLATPIIKDESLPSDQGYPAPSHEYGAYKQQTGIVPGALATTLAMNQSNQHMLGFLDYNSGGIDFAETDDFFDFSAPPSQSLMPSPESLHMMSPEASLFSHPTVDPNFIGGQEGGVMPPPLSSHVGRLRPGMHQQAAMAKAQQQKVLQQQRMNARKQAQQLPQQQAAAALAPNAQLIQANKMMVEQKINKVLGAVQCEEPKMEGVANHPVLNQPPKPKKSFEEMDADERLLASEEGKAMNRLEKRQVRNKVSARAFRERRKAYIAALEKEVIDCNNENSLLRAKNTALAEENKRLTDLSRMLLSSPAFSQMLNDLSAAPQPLFAPQQAQQQQVQQQQQPCGYVAAPPHLVGQFMQGAPAEAS